MTLNDYLNLEKLRRYNNGDKHTCQVLEINKLFFNFLINENPVKYEEVGDETQETKVFKEKFGITDILKCGGITWFIKPV